MTPTDIKSQWRESWKSAPVVNVHLVDDPTNLHLISPYHDNSGLSLNRFCTGQGHCGACRKTWCLTDTDLCPCGPDDVPYRWILPSYQAERWSVSASLCRCCCYCLADQLRVLITYATRRKYKLYSRVWHTCYNKRLVSWTQQHLNSLRYWHSTWHTTSILTWYPFPRHPYQLQPICTSLSINN